MITVDLRIKNTELTITSARELSKFLESESTDGLEGSISYDGTKHFAYSLAEVMSIISSLNIGDLSNLVSVEVDLENSSKEIQEIILDAIVEIDSLENRSEVNVGDDEFHNNIINNSVYQIRLFQSSLIVLNVDMHDRFLFNDELEYEHKSSRHISLTNSQISGIKSYFREDVLAKYDTSASKKFDYIDLQNSHEDIKNIAIGLVRQIDNLDAKADISIMSNNPQILIENDNKYSVYTIGSTLYAHKEGTKIEDFIDGIGHQTIALTIEQICQCVTEDHDYDHVDEYVLTA